MGVWSALDHPEPDHGGLFFGGCVGDRWILVGGTACFIAAATPDPSQPHPRLHGRTNGTLRRVSSTARLVYYDRLTDQVQVGFCGSGRRNTAAIAQHRERCTCNSRYDRINVYGLRGISKYVALEIETANVTSDLSRMKHGPIRKRWKNCGWAFWSHVPTLRWFLRETTQSSRIR